MKVITLLTGGDIGGIESLCVDYGRYSKHDNLMLMLWEGGPIADRMKELGIRVKVLNASRRNVFATVGAVMKVIEEEKADVLIAQHEASMSHLCLMRAKKVFPDIRTIAYAQLNAVDMIRADEKKRLWLRKAVLGRSLKKADRVVAISQSVKKSLIDVMGTPEDSISIIYNGSDQRAYPYHEREYSGEKCELMYVGRLIAEKGVQLTIKALSEVADKSRFRLRIAGDGDYRQELENLTKDLKLYDIVEFLGSRTDVPELLKTAEVFIHMPVWAEGFGIAVTEAMSSGCICICADNGAMPELITDSEDGFLVGKEDHEALARKLEYVSALSKEDKIKLSKAAHEKSKVFSIDRFVRDLDGLVSELAGE